MSAADFAALTGLTPVTAAALLDRFHDCTPVALASFVQSRQFLPASCFDNLEAHKGNADAIDERLLKLYATVRALVKKHGCREVDAWAAFEAAAGNVDAITIPQHTPVPIAPVLVSATRFAGPFFDMPNFWEKEVIGRAPLLNKNMGFLERNRGTLRPRLLKWYHKAGPWHQGTPLVYVPITDPGVDPTRTIIKDSVRTFFEEEHRQKFTEFLVAVNAEFKAYGQPMSYVAGLCLLVLTEQETVSILRMLNSDYIAGHWANEATGFAVNAWVVGDFIEKRFPKVGEHFQRMNFWYDTFLQKIMSSLCIHVLYFQELFQFLDAFIEEGFPWLIKFVLALVDHFQEKILTTTAINELFDLMKLDDRFCRPNDAVAILQKAKMMDLGLGVEDQVFALRAEKYDKIIGPRLKKAPKEEAFEPCPGCDQGKPVWYCDECEQSLCDACHVSGKLPGHLPTHAVEKY